MRPPQPLINRIPQPAFPSDDLACRVAANGLSRRRFLRHSALLGIAALGAGGPISRGADAPTARRRFTLCLSCGPIGVPGNPRQEMAWATQYGFEALEPAPGFLAQLNEDELRAYCDAMKAAQLVWGAASLPTQFRGGDAEFERDLKALPAVAQVLQKAGVNRIATWLTPTHRSLTYIANFRLHAQRLREVSRVLGDHGLRLGLEYVGPKTSWSSGRFPFIHTMAEMKDLIAEIGRDNVGFLLDSWHWYTARETAEDIRSLRAQDVVLVHVNDAPAGIEVDQQIDNRRDLPGATGVIDLKGFLGALLAIGYDGPVVCEPFSQPLRQMPPEQALATVAAALKRTIAIVEPG